ncbi:peptide-binding protein [Shewanella mangrovi]|uniref:Peptide-binding protein n=1 Tax=Shewanella mangrovi TaxID=1515746 RepID=A0A094JIM0_9GAMM|nr:TIGR04211 family SH3 domain-containing protein [Shewanella mangrovi]KFZ39067.1 peptide-binding protein [Shewanella mangrovi]
MLRGILLIGTLLFASATIAEEQTGYISDDIYIYIHGGPGNQYRILGSIEAGQKITLTGETDGDYSKIIDHKEREGWVKTDFLTQHTTFRYQLPDLQSQLQQAQQQMQSAISAKAQESSQIDELKSQLAEAKQALSQATKDRDEAQQQLTALHDDAQYKMWREGGLIAAIGALIAVVLVYLPRPRAKKRDRWF